MVEAGPLPSPIEHPAGGPIFIGGLAHSGKTPLRLALEGHTNVAFSRRTYMWNRFYGRFGELSNEDNFERCLRTMLQVRAIRQLCADPDLIRKQFWLGPPTYGRLFALFHEQHAQRLGNRRWGDQLGFVERFADPIFESYPEARMIQMIRDPRDLWTVAMQHSQFRKGKVGWSTARWLHSAGLARQNQARYARRYKVVQYEGLMAATEETLRDICAFLGERFVPEMVENIISGKGSRNVEGNAAHLSGRSKKVQNVPGSRLSRREATFTQRYAASHLMAFGYPQDETSLSWRDHLLFFLVDWPVNRASMAAWQVIQATSRGAHTGRGVEI